MTDDSDGHLAKILQTLSSSPHDEIAWRDLYELMKQNVFDLASDEADGNDALAQEAFQQAFGRLPFDPRFDQLADPSRFRAFVVTLVREAIAELRQDELPIVPLGPRVPDHDPGSEAQLLAFLREPHDGSRERRERLAKALQALPERERDALLQWADGATVTEIAARNRVVYSTARTRLNNGKWRLGRLLGLIPGDPST